MKLVEDIRVAHLPLQPMVSAHTSVNFVNHQDKPQLSMVWKVESKAGHERLIAKWVVVG